MSNIIISEKDDIVLLNVLGKIAKPFFVQFKQILSDLIKDKKLKVVMDLSGAKGLKLGVFGAIAVLIQAFDRTGGRFAVVQPAAERVNDMKDGNFEKLFNSFVTLEDAVEYLKTDNHLDMDRQRIEEELVSNVQRKFWALPEELKNGDVLANPIYSDAGTLIIKENAVLTERLIEKIKQLGKEQVQIFVLGNDPRTRNLIEKNHSDEGKVELKEREEVKEDNIVSEVTYEKKDDFCLVKFHGEIAGYDTDVLSKKIETMPVDLFIFDMTDVKKFNMKLILPFTNAIYTRDDVACCFIGLRESIELLFRNVSALRSVRNYDTLAAALKNKDKLLQVVYLSRKNNIITKSIGNIINGDIFARPVFDMSGNLLFRANEKITDNIVRKLSKEGITAVDVLKGN